MNPIVVISKIRIRRHGRRYTQLLKEVMRDAGDGPLRRRRLDMADPLHRECVMEMPGGEDFLSGELPDLHGSILNGRTPSRNDDYDLTDGAELCNVTVGDGIMGAYGCFDLLEDAGVPPPPTRAYACISLYDGERLVGREFSFSYNTNRGGIETVRGGTPE